MSHDILKYLYANVLLRKYNNKEFNYHLNRLKKNISNEQLLEEFLSCNEMNMFLNKNILDSKYDLYNTGIVENSNIYSDILFFCPNEKNNFSSLIMIKENNNTVIKYSNSYIIDTPPIHSKNYNALYKIYDRLYLNKLRILFYKNFCNYTIINKTVVNGISPFYNNNCGHDLTFILNIINIGLTTNNDIFDYDIVIMEDMYNFTKNIIKFFFKNIIELKSNSFYKFSRIIIYKPEIFNIIRYSNITDIIIKKIKNNNYKTYDKICLYKNSKNNFIRNDIILEKYSNIFENNNFKLIIPEDYNDTNELIYILNNAKEVIMQTGGICYTNYLFLNSNAKINYIVVDERSHNYINELKKHFISLINVVHYNNVENFIKTYFNIKTNI